MKKLIVIALALFFAAACAKDVSPEPIQRATLPQPSVSETSAASVQPIVEPTYRGHIGTDERFFQLMQVGEWEGLLEQNALIFRTRRGFRIYDFDEREGEGTNIRFQSLHVDGKCGKTIGNYVALPYECVTRERWVSWPEIKGFLREEMSAADYADMKESVETYLKEERLIK